MNLGGWIMLVFSWAIITALFGFCLFKMVGKKEDEEQASRSDKGTN